MAKRFTGLRPLILTAAFCVIASSAQPTEAQATRVYKSSISATWSSDGNRFWYRNDLRDGKQEYILVDVEKGTRSVAFDHQRLADSLNKAGVDDAKAEQLNLSSLKFDHGTAQFHAGGRNWTCDLQSYEVSEVDGAKIGNESDGTAVHPDDAPSRSGNNGRELVLQFVNQTNSTVELFWLDTGGRRVSYGKIKSGATQEKRTFANHVWLAVDEGGEVVSAFDVQDDSSFAIISTKPIARRKQQRNQRRRSRSNRRGSDTSADGQWRAFVRDGNVFVESVKDESDEPIQLTKDGSQEVRYSSPSWSPDSASLATFKVTPGDRKSVYRIESSPRGGGRAKLHERTYALPGDKFTSHELHLFRLTDSGESSDWHPVETDVEPVDFGWPRIRWSSDGSTFTYTKVDRGHQRYRIIEVDAKNGNARHVLDEQTDTFIWTAHIESIGVGLVTWLEDSNEIIYASEVDGNRHLYLIDPTAHPEGPDESQISNGKKLLFAGGLKNQITKGDFVVRAVERIDEESRQIWFRASGRDKDQDPYFLHHYRVNFDGTGLVQLTAGNGDHSVRYSPDRRFLIDTYSRVDAAPVHELRRVKDGKLVCKLEEADTSELEESGWKPPEVFVAKGRDGETDIWGFISRPKDFDPNKRYPVIENIYAGPQGSFVPKTFSSRRRYASLTDLGFIVVKIDGMGTANRSKAFHDTCWHNLKDGGFPDRILWMKAAAKDRPEMDLSRVGVYGGSAGGQNAAAGVLFHGDFYKAAVAGCGCHDNRMDKASWNEQWMGYPVESHYSDCSNIDNAYRLENKLMLIVGEMDSNVPPESTMRFADALIRADKDFDLIVVPGAGHGMGGRYGNRRMHDFFVEHLIESDEAERATVLTKAATTETPPATRSSFVAESQPKVKADKEEDELQDAPEVTVPPASFFRLVDEDDRDEARKFYKKYINIDGLPVVAAAEVTDEALQRTHSMVTHMLAGRPDILRALVGKGMYLIIIGKDQVYTDMPENRNHPDPDYVNERVRGTGGRPTSFGEENLIGWPVDRYDDESIGVHEFLHTIDGGLRSIDPTWTKRRNQTYENAMKKGLYKYAYAASNPGEYWAEIAQTYFDSQRVNNWNHGPVGTREQLKEYDPEGYELCRNTFQLSPEAGLALSVAKAASQRCRATGQYED